MSELLTKVQPHWYPRCAKCNKTVDRVEIITQSSFASRYRVWCHGEEEDGVVGIWAAFEYDQKGIGLPDSFTESPSGLNHAPNETRTPLLRAEGMS